MKCFSTTNRQKNRKGLIGDSSIQPSPKITDRTCKVALSCGSLSTNINLCYSFRQCLTFYWKIISVERKKEDEVGNFRTSRNVEQWSSMTHASTKVSVYNALQKRLFQLVWGHWYYTSHMSISCVLFQALHFFVSLRLVWQGINSDFRLDPLMKRTESQKWIHPPQFSCLFLCRKI